MLNLIQCASIDTLFLKRKGHNKKEMEMRVKLQKLLGRGITFNP